MTTSLQNPWCYFADNPAYEIWTYLVSISNRYVSNGAQCVELGITKYVVEVKCMYFWSRYHIDYVISTKPVVLTTQMAS